MLEHRWANLKYVSMLQWFLLKEGLRKWANLNYVSLLQW
jgi:hypothetical protein